MAFYYAVAIRTFAAGLKVIIEVANWYAVQVSDTTMIPQSTNAGYKIV